MKKLFKLFFLGGFPQGEGVPIIDLNLSVLQHFIYKLLLLDKRRWIQTQMRLKTEEFETFAV